VLDPELKKCEEENKPFLLTGREDLFPKYEEYPLAKWVEGVVPPRAGMTVPIFLRTLGRGCDKYIDRFPTWNHLFLMKTRDMRVLGIPLHQRKWILRWVEAYRCGRDPVLITKTQSKGRKNLKKKKAGLLK